MLITLNRTLTGPCGQYPTFAPDLRALRSAISIASHQYSTWLKRAPTSRRQFDECMVSAVAFVETDFDSALPRRSDALQAGSLAPDA